MSKISPDLTRLEMLRDTMIVAAEQLFADPEDGTMPTLMIDVSIATAEEYNERRGPGLQIFELFPGHVMYEAKLYCPTGSWLGLFPIKASYIIATEEHQEDPEFCKAVVLRELMTRIAGAYAVMQINDLSRKLSSAIEGLVPSSLP